MFVGKMGRKSIDFGTFTYWRTSTNDVNLGSIPSERVLNQKKSLASKRRSRGTNKPHRRHLHRNISLELPEQCRAKVLVESSLHKERERLESNGLAEEVDEFDVATNAMNNFMQRFADEHANAGNPFEFALQRNPIDSELITREVQLTRLIRYYEQEINEWEHVLKNDEITRNDAPVISSDHFENDEPNAIIDTKKLHNEASNAVYTYIFYADKLLKELKRLEHTNELTSVQVQSIAMNIIGRYNHTEFSTENLTPPACMMGCQ